MDLSDIPSDVPVVLQSLYSRKNLQNPPGSKQARCMEDNRDEFEQIILRRAGDKVAIESARNGRLIQIPLGRGECVFGTKIPGEEEFFNVEMDRECALYFVSSRTGNSLHCGAFGNVTCVYKKRATGEKWRLVRPHGTAATKQEKAAAEDFQIHAMIECRHTVVDLIKCGTPLSEVEEMLTVFLKRINGVISGVVVTHFR